MLLRGIQIPAGTAIGPSVTWGGHRVVLLQRYPLVRQNYSCKGPNSIHNVEPKKPFEVLLGTFGSTTVGLQRPQVVSTALPHTYLVMKTNLTLPHMLGIADGGQAGPSIPSIEYKLSLMERKAKVLK